jgi:hypothetical protein
MNRIWNLSRPMCVYTAAILNKKLHNWLPRMDYCPEALTEQTHPLQRLAALHSLLLYLLHLFPICANSKKARNLIFSSLLRVQPPLAQRVCLLRESPVHLFFKAMQGRHRLRLVTLPGSRNFGCYRMTREFGRVDVILYAERVCRPFHIESRRRLE